MNPYSDSSPVVIAPLRSGLAAQLAQVSTQCSQCQRCVAECQFLRQHGDPKKIAAAYSPAENAALTRPFSCSLCGLCTAVCPDGVDPAALFIEMRRESFERRGETDPAHKGLEAYEKRGTSRRFSWYALPAGCDTIFFPGCGLPGTRPEQTLQAFALLQQQLPTAGIVLDCCTKPSHDLGKEHFFHAMFGEMAAFLVEHGVKKVLVACPNCLKVFTQYGASFETRTIYEFLDDAALPVTAVLPTEVHVHDPCVARFSPAVHDAVRSLAEKQGLTVVESRHSRRTTFCCGEGGAVEGVAPALAQAWTQKRVREAGGNHILTYCTGCARFLGAHSPASHLLDLLFEPAAALAGQTKVARAPLTYFNRLRLKRVLQKKVPAATTRERTFTADASVSGGRLARLAILALIVGVMLAVGLSTGTEAFGSSRLLELLGGRF